MNRDKPLILDVDDDDAGRYAVGRQLAQAGFEVIGAADGRKGLELAAIHKPDLILLDVRLPDIDGFEVCRRLRENPDIGSTPIIQMSASYIDTSSQVRGLDNGADAYLTEPVEPAILLATINSVLRIKRAEQTVRSAALRWQATFDAIQEGVALLDEQGSITQSNKAFAQIVGDNTQKIASLTSPLFAQLKATGERRTDEDAAGERILAIAMDPVIGDHGFAGAVCTIADVTEKKSFDQQLRHTAKLESIGVLAGGIAHDFNNLLTGILGNSSLLLDTLSSQSAERQLAEEIVKASESAADLTRQILAYSGRGRFVMQPVDLSVLALASRAFVRRFIPGNVELIYEVVPGLPMIQADPSQMQQLMMNLIINAAEAFEEKGKGTITVRTRAENLDKNFFRAGENSQPGEYASLVIEDTGSGMDEATQSRIFDPFFTTKFAGRGLGLSAVHGILRGHSGLLRLDTNVGRGSTFSLYFPVSENTERKLTAAPKVTAQKRSGLILVIDDEPTVRNFAKIALTGLGYQVLTADTGSAGLEAFRQNHEKLSLVLLDLTMPVMDGEETFDRLREVNPNVPVLLSSGFSQATATKRFEMKSIAGYLGKPYTVPQLAAAVDAALKAKVTSSV